MSRCPTCFKPSVAAFKPFCSDKCRMVDLNRWMTGSYSTPAIETDDVDFEALEEAINQREQDGE